MSSQIPAYKIVFLFAFLFVALGGLMKVNHWEGGPTLLLVGVIAYAVSIAFSVYEVNTSQKLSRQEKILWTFALLFLGIPVWMFYYFKRNSLR
jgi:ABC-type amino acid transport system permease subunit